MDERSSAYTGLHTNMVDESGYLRQSAQVTFEFLSRFLPLRSVLDVGCGIGIWLVEAQARGCDIVGVDGPWLDRSKLLVPEDQVIQRDLESEIDLGRRFDLAVSLEVAEHLSSAAAATFVRSLVNHAEVILFSAAVPEQGGAHHINEQWPSYWQRLFAAHGYRCVDLLRPVLWADTRVGSWYRQNMLLYVAPTVLERYPDLRRWTIDGIVQALIHPDLFIPTKRRLAELERVMDFLSEGGDFRVGHDEQGRMTLNRLPRTPG